MIFDVKLRIFGSKISRCEREREREKERGVHGREFLCGPCNEVHGNILVVDTSQKQDVSISVYVCDVDILT